MPLPNSPIYFRLNSLLGDCAVESLDCGGLKCSRHCHETLFYWLARSGLRFADWAIANTMMILGSYFPWPGLGKIARDGSGYASTVRTA
jgi:hypothetical protein